MHPEQLFRQQSGVASTADLHNAGLGRRDIERLCSERRLTRIRRGWLAAPDADPNVVAAVTIGGALTCTSELRRRGLFSLDDGRLHLAVPSNASRLGAVAGMKPVIHWGNQILKRRPGTPIDPLDNVVAHIVDCQPAEWAAASLDSVMRFSPRVNASRLSQIGDQMKSGRLAALIPRLDPRAESGLESLLRFRLADAGITMTPQVQLGRFRVDGLIGDRLIIEAAGYEFHSARPDFESDHLRAADLQHDGFLLLQFTWRQIVHDWPRVLATIQAHVARGDHLHPSVRTRATL